MVTWAGNSFMYVWLLGWCKFKSWWFPWHFYTPSFQNSWTIHCWTICLIFLKKLYIGSAHQSLDFVTEQHVQWLQSYTKRKKRASLRLLRA